MAENEGEISEEQQEEATKVTEEPVEEHGVVDMEDRAEDKITDEKRNEKEDKREDKDEDKEEIMDEYIIDGKDGKDEDKDKVDDLQEESLISSSPPDIEGTLSLCEHRGHQ